MSFYKTYKPSSSVCSFVREFEVYHANWNIDTLLPQPFITCLANTTQGLYFYLNDAVKVVPAAQVEIPAPPIVVTGPKTKPIGLLFGSDHLMVKATFQPTGLYRLLGIDMRTTANKGIDAVTFWGDELKHLAETLRLVEDYDQMHETLSAFLENKIKSSCRAEEPIDRTTIKMLDPQMHRSLTEWADDACLSLRQFERNFTMRVGLSPKLFIRIVRFENAMAMKNAKAEKSWSQIALECGYTDSSHLLREFNEFAEFPPSKFYLQPTSGHSDFPTG